MRKVLVLDPAGMPNPLDPTQRTKSSGRGALHSRRWPRGRKWKTLVVVVGAALATSARPADACLPPGFGYRPLVPSAPGAEVAANAGILLEVVDDDAPTFVFLGGTGGTSLTAPSTLLGTLVITEGYSLSYHLVGRPNTAAAITAGTIRVADASAPARVSSVDRAVAFRTADDKMAPEFLGFVNPRVEVMTSLGNSCQSGPGRYARFSVSAPNEQGAILVESVDVGAAPRLLDLRAFTGASSPPSFEFFLDRTEPVRCVRVTAVDLAGNRTTPNQTCCFEGESTMGPGCPGSGVSPMQADAGALVADGSVSDGAPGNVQAGADAGVQAPPEADGRDSGAASRDAAGAALDAADPTLVIDRSTAGCSFGGLGGSGSGTIALGLIVALVLRRRSHRS